MKTALIVLSSIALILGIVAYFSIFSGSQIIQPTVTSQTNQSSTPMFVMATSSPTSSVVSATESSTTFLSSGSTTTFQTLFTGNFPVTWTEGQAQFSITGASLSGNDLSLIINIQTGSSTQCIPADLRLVIDEQGDIEAPSTPASPNFLLGAGGDCTPAANTSYANQLVNFTVDPTVSPYLFTTGDASNIYFEVSTTTNNGLDISLPSTSG